MISLTLNKNIDCNNLCKKIGEYVGEYNKEYGDLKDCVLVIDIKKIVDSQETNNIANIEFRQ